MSTLIKLGIRLNIICIFGMIVAAIAVYIFNLGGWKIGGVYVFTILVFLSYAALIISFLQNLIFKPVLSTQATRLAKQTVMLSENEDVPFGQISFVNEVIDAKNRHERVRYISGAIIGTIVFFLLGINVGSPIAEFVSLVVLLLAPTIVGIVIQGALTKMRMLDPDLFESGIQLYFAAHHASFNASLIA